MRLKTKIWSILGLLMLLILTVDLSLGYRQLRSELRRETEFDARTVYGLVMATRRIYQQQFIDSELPVNARTIGFLPAHSFSRIAREYARWNTDGVVFNNVSDAPRNPDNRADRFEAEAIAWFRAHPETTERLDDIVDAQGSAFLLYTAPIRIESFCLKCHGSRAEAPPSIRDAYDSAFDLAVGDVHGAVSVKIPKSKFETRFRQVWGGQIVKSVLGYLLLFGMLGLILDRLLTRRLVRLRDGAERFAAGGRAVRMPLAGSDEIGALAKSFNEMAEAVDSRERQLGLLSQAVAQSPVSILITDTAGRIEYVNDFFEQHTGYPRAEAIGQTPRLLRSPATPPETHRAMWEALVAGRVWRGELVNRRKDGSEFVAASVIGPVCDSAGRVTHYLAVEQDISGQREAEARAHRLAYFHPLTGLPNRTQLLDRMQAGLAQARRRGHCGALLLIDIDRFKNFNDARGHPAGDRLLVAFGRNLAGLLREEDLLAHLGADEFAVFLQDAAGRSDLALRSALEVANKIQASLRQPLRFADGEECLLDASIGATVCPEGEDDSPQEALRRCDMALDRARQAGGARSECFESTMAADIEHRFAIEHDLRRGIPAGELRLFLQAQVDADSHLVGAEALVRWQHPERGLLPPAVFIPVAEASDLIAELGDWVLDQACQVLAATRAEEFSLSVNLSPRHFRRDGFVPRLRALLDRHGAAPARLVLEITEGLMIDDANSVAARMRELTDLGIRFSVDDFGTGYSSLAYLKRLPIHELKIDQAFIREAPDNPDDAALVETILAVAAHLRLQVVAEGVETRAQADFLNARGRIIHQGYLYGRPEAAAEWLARWSPR